MNRRRMEQHAGLTGAKRELERVKRDIEKVIDAIVQGFGGPELKAHMDGLQERKDALLAQLAAADEPPPLVHPSIADLYRTKVEELASALQREDIRLEACELLRGLIESIVLTPEMVRLKPNPTPATLASRACGSSCEGIWPRCWLLPKRRKGRQKLATFTCRFNWLRGPATIWIWNFPGPWRNSRRRAERSVRNPSLPDSSAARPT